MARPIRTGVLSGISPYTDGPIHKTALSRATIPAQRKEPLSKVSFDLEKDFKYDSSDDEKEDVRTTKSVQQETARSEHQDKGAVRFIEMCRKYGIVAMNSVAKQIGAREISIEGMDLNQKEQNAFFTALGESYVSKDVGQTADASKELRQLHLGGNTLRTKEINSLIKFANAHTQLGVIILNGCNVCSEGLHSLSSFTSRTKTLRKLDLSDNHLTDNDGGFVSDIIEYGESITELILRRNNLSDCGTCIGRSLAKNNTLTLLDLSWNHIRGRGAVGLCKGVKDNKCLRILNVAWNGFDFHGVVAMRQALAVNSTLAVLDLSNNRINPIAVVELTKGLVKNKTLSSLNLAHNPISAWVCNILLTKLYKHKASHLRELNLQGVVVDEAFKDMLVKLQEERLFVARCDVALPLCRVSLAKEEGNDTLDIDPIQVMMYMKEYLNTIGVLLDSDADSMVKDEIKHAFEMGGLPISDTNLRAVMDYLDSNKEEEVDTMLLRAKLDDDITMIGEVLEDVNIR